MIPHGNVFPTGRPVGSSAVPTEVKAEDVGNKPGAARSPRARSYRSAPGFRLLHRGASPSDPEAEPAKNNFFYSKFLRAQLTNRAPPGTHGLDRIGRRPVCLLLGLLMWAERG